jgi:hypothetical protein
VRQPARAMLNDDKHVQRPERDGDGYEEVAGEDGRRVVLQERGPALVAAWQLARSFGMYLRTVRGEMRLPSLSSSSLAIRSSPQRGFSLDIRRISARSSAGIGRRPRRDLIRHSSRHRRVPADHGCWLDDDQSAAPSNNLASIARLTRVPASIGLGRTARSTYRAS